LNRTPKGVVDGQPQNVKLRGGYDNTNRNLSTNMTYTEEASPLYGYTGADETVSGRSCRPRQSKFLDVRILDMHKNRNEKLKAKALAEE
jgi:hypothetical protein